MTLSNASWKDVLSSIEIYIAPYPVRGVETLILTRRHFELPNLAKVILMIRKIRLFPCADVDPAHPSYAKSNAANSEEDDKDADGSSYTTSRKRTEDEIWCSRSGQASMSAPGDRVGDVPAGRDRLEPPLRPLSA